MHCTSVIFLDIDGVLNGHEWVDGAQSCTIRRSCVTAFNNLLSRTNAKIVISSAWRYMIHLEAMKLLGFEYLLRTHGVCGIVHRVIDVTCSDEDIPTRARQINRWLDEHPKVTSFVILDDDPMDLRKTDLRNNLVRTNPDIGLTMANSRRAIAILQKGPFRCVNSRRKTPGISSVPTKR